MVNFAAAGLPVLAGESGAQPHSFTATEMKKSCTRSLSERRLESRGGGGESGSSPDWPRVDIRDLTGGRGAGGSE